MPNRMLRDWTNSEKVNSLSVHAERFFTRLIMKADDYGCFYADARLLKANLFPFLLDTIREADLLRWMAECQKAGLIVLYESSNKQYLQIAEFNQRLRQKTQKFPLPTNDSSMTAACQHDDSTLRHEEEVEEKLEGKVNGIDGGEPPAHSPEEKTLFTNFQTFIKDKAPNVSRMKEPFTIDQYLKLKKDFTSEEIKSMLLKMHNWKDLVKKNVSSYLTFLNWSRKDFNHEGPATPVKSTAKLSNAVNAIENGSTVPAN